MPDKAKISLRSRTFIGPQGERIEALCARASRPRMRTRHGPDKPIDTNATPEGGEKNRRTDIKVYANPAG